MEHGMYLSGIKKALRSRAITYGELAQRLRMTESGVKKMLNAKDISFRRVLQICDVLDVLPGQLFSLSEKTAVSIWKLSGEQEDALLHDRKLLAVYWRFAVEKQPPEEIAQLQGFTPIEARKLLQRLVSLGLIGQRRGNFFVKQRGKFRWPDDSRLAQTLNREWSRLVLDRALSKKTPNESKHRLATWRLSEASAQELWRKLDLLAEEMAQVSEREEFTLPANALSDYMLLLAAVPGSVLSLAGKP